MASEFGSPASSGQGSGGVGGVGVSDMTVVNWWELALIALGPVIAFLYALTVAIFLPGWGECAFSSLFPSLMPRNSLLIFAIAFAVHRNNGNSDSIQEDELEEQGGLRLLVAVCISAAASWYLIHETRCHQVEGGPAPSFYEQKGKVVVITGSNAGIGKETARQLYRTGATVILACRSLERAKTARDEIMASCAADADSTDNSTDTDALVRVVGKLEIQSLDLGSLQSVRQAAKELLKKYKTIDILINNAGIMMDEQTVTQDGYDFTMQANYLGHYLLTRLLLPAIQKSKDPRIINVTSSTYTLVSKIDLDDLFCQKGKRPYTLFGQYAQSKLAQILFTNELDSRYGEDDTSTSTRNTIFTASVHPGLVRTDVVRNLPAWMKVSNAMFAWIIAALQKTPEQGAWCSVYVATAPRDDLPDAGGAYWVNRRTQETRPYAQSESDAKALWDVSAKLVGLDDK
jgi:retinol dehydrogenase-12